MKYLFGDTDLATRRLKALADVQYVDSVLGSGTKQGYRFEVCAGTEAPEFVWSAVASPVQPGTTGDRYFFVNHEEFEAMRAAGKFLEHAEVFGNYYGTGIQQIEDRQAEGLDVILEVDWQGARNIREQMNNVLSIFILPPSIETLRQRLVSRGRDDKQVIDSRMDAAAAEMSHHDEYDFLIVNDDFQLAIRELAAIIERKWQNTANLAAKVRLEHPNLIAEIADI